MLRLITIIGARPQFIKAAAVSRTIATTSGMSETLVHTGQHYDSSLSEVFFTELAIPTPDYNLGIGSCSHGKQTGQMLEAIEPVLIQEKPDWVLVYGDTNSTLAGALAAAKLHLPIAHVEAGLRSFNRRMPEEVNRVLTDHCSDLLFAPTQQAVLNLACEGISSDRIFLVGDVMYDAALIYGNKADSNSQILEQLNLQSQNYILATVHRAENTDHPQRLQAIFAGLSLVARELPVVLPLHPRTRKVLEQTDLLSSLPPAFKIVDPFGYLDMIRLEKQAWAIATDSGGVQKEAFFYRVPCITLREETEWVELVELGWNQLVDPIDSQAIAHALLNASAPPAQPGLFEPYGQGEAAQKIVEIIRQS
jgi:UDP-GlcNAc3NAcA epimerase